MKNYDHLLDDVARENYGIDYDIVALRYGIKLVEKIHREAAELYRAQVELPSDDEIEEHFKERYPITQRMPSARRLAQLSNKTLEISGAKWMRDHIAKQLKQGI